MTAYEALRDLVTRCDSSYIDTQHAHAALKEIEDCMSMAPRDFYRALDNMRMYGGSFAQSLAETATRADNQNLARLKAAFAEVFIEYGDF